MTDEEALWSLVLFAVFSAAIGAARLLVWLSVRSGDRWQI